MAACEKVPSQWSSQCTRETRWKMNNFAAVKIAFPSQHGYGWYRDDDAHQQQSFDPRSLAGRLHARARWVDPKVPKASRPRLGALRGSESAPKLKGGVVAVLLLVGSRRAYARSAKEQRYTKEKAGPLLHAKRRGERGGSACDSSHCIPSRVMRSDREGARLCTSS